MATRLDSNRAARDAVLARVRKALGKTGDRGNAVATADRYVAGHAQGPRPPIPADRVAHFMKRAADLGSSVERVVDRHEIAAAVARYLARAGAEAPRAGVCWPELADLDWKGAGLDIEARATTGNDRLGITGSFCAIAETGTLVVLSAADTPTATTLLPETHVAVVRADRVVAGMEEAFELIRREKGTLPRAINMISGPSRTGDIEQTIVLGAHGPFRVHIIVVG
jgi:L-lactate dehydrogenase complex protein LldG